MATYELRVTGMTCGCCESIPEQRVGGLDGVRSVDADSGGEPVVVEGEGGSATASQTASRTPATTLSSNCCAGEALLRPFP